MLSRFLFVPPVMMKLSLHQHPRKALLPHCLINNNRNGIGKIQASCRLQHGNPNGVFLMCHQNLLRNTGAFLPKHDVIILAIGHIRINMACLRGCHPKPCIGVLFAKIRKIIIISNIQQLPIIQACPLQIFILDGKPQRLNQMQNGIGHRTGACNVSCILGNFRLQ